MKVVKKKLKRKKKNLYKHHDFGEPGEIITFSVEKFTEAERMLIQSFKKLKLNKNNSSFTKVKKLSNPAYAQ